MKLIRALKFSRKKSNINKKVKDNFFDKYEDELRLKRLRGY